MEFDSIIVLAGNPETIEWLVFFWVAPRKLFFFTFDSLLFFPTHFIDFFLQPSLFAILFFLNRFPRAKAKGTILDALA